MLKRVFVFSFLLLLAACGGSSDSGGNVENTQPGDMLPANFIGTYTGTLTLTASAAGLTQTESAEITLIVAADGTVTFRGDDPDETFTVGISNAGEFSGFVDIVEDECSGNISVQGSVDGTNATASVQGEGSCTVNGLTVNVDLTGNLTASK